MTDPRNDEFKILAPVEAKPRIDYMRRAVQEPEGFGITRRQLLGLGGMAAFVAFAAACGTTTTGGGTSTAAPTASNTLAGRPLESKLQIYNWSQYDAASTYTKFENLPAEKAAGLNIHETYYSSNDELLAKLNAGAGGYDIIAPSQNAVAQLIQEGKLMAMDQSLLPNLKYLDPKFLKVAYDPTGQYHVIKDYGITMFFYNNKIITEQPKTMKDFYDLLNKYVSKGRTNILDGAEEVVPLALMALGLDPEHERPERPRSGPHLPALRAQGRHHHQFVQLHQRRDRRQDHPGAGLERRCPTDRRWTQGPGRHHAGPPHGGIGDLGGQLVHPGRRSSPGSGARLDQLAAHAEHGCQRDELPQLPHSHPECAGANAGIVEERPPLQRAGHLHRQLQVRPEREPAGRSGAD